MTLPYFIVVTFADRAFSGNPAGVCLLARWLDDQTMRKIAAESACPATAFLIPGATVAELRWFTPVVEEEMCGHGTLGAAWVMLNELQPSLSQAVFRTRAGQLTVGRSGDGYVLDLPARSHRRVARDEAIDAAIGRPAAEHLASHYHVAVMKSGRDVAELAPNLDLIARLPLPGLIVTGPGDEYGCDVVSRYFAPAKGIPEDHATGSAHSQIIPYWSQRLDKARIKARQLSPRGGAMVCHHVGNRIAIEADARLYLRGEIFLEVQTGSSTIR